MMELCGYLQIYIYIHVYALEIVIYIYTLYSLSFELSATLIFTVN